MSIRPLTRTPRIVKSLMDEGLFIKALYNALTEINTAVNAILEILQGDSWISAILLNSWADYGLGFAPSGYILDAQGYVHFRGAVKSGSGAIFALPIGYRPPHMVAVTGMSANHSPCQITVASDGNVTVDGGSNAFVALDGICFKAAT